MRFIKPFIILLVNVCVQTVDMMHKIAREAEASVYHKQLFEELRLLTPRPTDVTHTTALAAVEASVNCLAAAIIVITTTGTVLVFLSSVNHFIIVLTSVFRARTGLMVSTNDISPLFTITCHLSVQTSLPHVIHYTLVQSLLSPTSASLIPHIQMSTN